jgi:DNA-binding MarR family transcriptional regulator
MPNEAPDLWFSYVKVHRLMIREIERRLAAAELPPYAWYDALWGIESGAQGRRRMFELAEALVIERYNLSRLVDRLESEGLVSRSRSADDGRATFVEITAAGRALRKKMWKVYEQAVGELFLSRFAPNAQRVFSDALSEVADGVRADG